LLFPHHNHHQPYSSSFSSRILTTQSTKQQQQPPRKKENFLQSRLGLTSEAGETIRLLLSLYDDNNNSNSNQDEVLLQSLADQLIAEKNCPRAEAILLPVVAKLDAEMGRASPQAIGGRRSLLRAVWMLRSQGQDQFQGPGQGQGLSPGEEEGKKGIKNENNDNNDAADDDGSGGENKNAAEVLVREIEGSIRGMVGGKYEVYVEEELARLSAELRGSGSGSGV
jgi:hypothetical protein